MLTTNLLADLPDATAAEIFQDIVKTENVRIERIVSQGQITPDDQWYDQDENEWVLVLSGKAKLLIEQPQGEVIVELNSGDHINLAAHQRHKVLWTDPSQQTVWLAVFY